MIITAAVFINKKTVKETKETGQEPVVETETVAEEPAKEEPEKEEPVKEEPVEEVAEDIYEIEDVIEQGDGKFTFSFDGLEHDMIIDLPEEPAGAPLIIMLHGQGNTAESFRNTVHLENDANPKG